MPLKGFKHSEKTKQKIRLARAKQVMTAESNRKRSETQKGRTFSKESKEKMRQHAFKRFADKRNHPFYGKKFSPETLEKMSKAFKGKSFVERYGKKKARVMIEKIKLARSFQIFPKEDTKIEVKIQGFLEELGIEYIKHYYVKEIKEKYRCDIFIPSSKLVLEMDGDFWHGNPYIYSKKQLSEKQKDQKIRDKLRTDQMIQKGFKVIRLWEKDIKNLDIIKFQEIIK